jgi:hypothetical protein
MQCNALEVPQQRQYYQSVDVDVDENKVYDND